MDWRKDNMWVMSSRKNALVKAESLFVSPKKDKDDETKIVGWRVMATIATGRSIPLAFFATEEEAMKSLMVLSNTIDYVQA